MTSTKLTLESIAFKAALTATTSLFFKKSCGAVVALDFPISGPEFEDFVVLARGGRPDVPGAFTQSFVAQVLIHAIASYFPPEYVSASLPSDFPKGDFAQDANKRDALLIALAPVADRYNEEDGGNRNFETLQTWLERTCVSFAIAELYDFALREGDAPTNGVVVQARFSIQMM